MAKESPLVLNRPWGAMHYRILGHGPLVVFANALGTDLRLWDRLLPLLPKGLRYVRYDKPGHGLSDLAETVSIASLADDLAALILHLGGSATVVGLSVGGLTAQALAATRPDLVRALVLSNSAARLGTAASWQARTEAVTAHGLASIADGVMARWFTPAFRATPEFALWRNMLVRTSPTGYNAVCAALRDADQTAATARLGLPALVIAGAEDGAAPPDLVRATAALIAGAEFQVMQGIGHLPCVEAPAAYAAILIPFLQAHADG